MHAAPDDGHAPCERCHADAWLERRPSWPAGLLQWLGSGGAWRPTRTVCRVCGTQRASHGSWSIVLTGQAPNRWTVPYRVVRSVVLTVQGHRRVQPVPWIYLASGLLGGAVAAVLARPRRRLPPVVGGAAGGALLCWAGYASTARGEPGLADELVTAALQEVSPDRAAARRRARDAALAQTASFAVYGPVDAGGRLDPRWLGVSWEGPPVLVTSVSLGHGDPGDPAAPWVQVTSSVPGSGGGEYEDDEDSVAEDLWQRHQELGSDLVAPPRWEDGHLVVDGVEVLARRSRLGRSWSVLARVGEVQVVVRAHDLPLGIRLERVPGLIERYG